MFSNKEQITFTKVIILVFAIFMLTLSSVMATYYDCTKTVQTGCGYSKSTCSGKYLKCVVWVDQMGVMQVKEMLVLAFMQKVIHLILDVNIHIVILRILYKKESYTRRE